MKQCMDEENLHRRLRKIIGQVQAIDRMIEEDVPCEDVITQVNAAKSALHKVGQIILEGHLQHCVRDGIEHGDAEETIARFAKAVERFSNIVTAIFLMYNLKYWYLVIRHHFFMNQGKRDPEFIDHGEEIIFVSCESQSGRPSCAGHRRRPCGS